MPKTTKNGDARKSELPSTLQRSDAKAQRTYAKTHDSAADEHDDEQRANRIAWAAVKRTHEKVGDHWEPKVDDGPSDEQSARGNQHTDLGTKGGVDENASKEHLYARAQEAGIEGRSSMTKDELADALQRYNDTETARARE